MTRGSTSIPDADEQRELWRSGPHDYPDIVFLTARGDLGLKADFGRPVTMSIGEWHYLPEKIKQLSAGYASFPQDVRRVLSEMGDAEYCRYAKDVAPELRLSETRVREIRRALKVLGLAHCGTLVTDDGALAGRGYWRSRAGDALAHALHTARGIEAGTAETPQEVRSEGREPGAEGTRPDPFASPLPNKGETA